MQVAAAVGVAARLDWARGARQWPAMSETLPCPTCGRPVLVASAERPAGFPFCSTRCRSRDLGAWFDGTYTIAGTDLAALAEQDPGLEQLPRSRDRDRP